MELKTIRQTLQKYFEGESSEQEEQLLEEYFRSGDLDPALEKYRVLFSGIQELSVGRDEKLEEEIMDYILENEHREKNRYRWLWQAVSGIAAAVAIALVVVNFYANRYQWKDTYADPNQAYAEASQALRYMAAHYQKGLANLEPIKKINAASRPLHEGMGKLEKGFQDIQYLEKVNEKLKNQ
jgi:hypothetical protein